MQNTKTIEIDFAVHKRLEAERTSFSETPNEILRRILGIQSPRENPPRVELSLGRSWSWKGVELPHGTELRMEYNGRQHVGVIKNGIWHVEGEQYSSPSAAAGGVAKTKEGKSTSLDGWEYWYVKEPGQPRWTLIDKFRKR